MHRVEEAKRDAEQLLAEQGDSDMRVRLRVRAQGRACDVPCEQARQVGEEDGPEIVHDLQNYVEAANNDGRCPYNKATFSSDLVSQLVSLYSRGGVVYDPFVGSGTTLAACEAMGIDSIGSEISDKQCEWAADRVAGSILVRGADRETA